jgi:hypothetical protein
MFLKRAKAKLAAQARELEREAKQRELSVQLVALVESFEDGAGLRLDHAVSPALR